MNSSAVIDILAVIGAGTCLYWAVRLLRPLLKDAGGEDDTAQPGQPAQPVAAPPTDIAAEHIAAIAAAITVIVGSHHKIVHIDDLRTGASWSAEGRWMHQTSHNRH
jgi:hypothetical protein